jgi:hypothetical protein
MTVTAQTAPDSQLSGVFDDLARASLAMARRFSAGGTLWCTSPSSGFHAHHVAVEFVHPVIVGKRALAALTVPAGADVVATLRASVRPGDIVLALAPADDLQINDTMRRAPAWGAETIWIGAGAQRPEPGAADHVIWLDTDDPLDASEQFVRLYHLLWELTHVCFEHPGLLKAEPECTDDVCITCSDQGVLAEVIAIEGDETLVRTAEGQERIDTSLVDPPRPNDLLLVHAGSAITNLGGA